MNLPRKATVERTTAETDISLEINLDGSGVSDIDSGCGFLDHMLTLFSKHSRIDISLRCNGDTYVDFHHTVEDVGICLGEAIKSALGDMKGICRYGYMILPMDEAYVDFGAESCVGLIGELGNLIVCRTYSKSMSMAGARLGFAMASAGLISDLEKIKYSTNPYAVNRITLAAGEAAIDDIDYYRENCRKIINTRDATAQKLKEMGFEMTDSKANFLFVKTDRMPGKLIFERLREKGILVRRFDEPRISDYLRITVGTPEEMDALADALKDILA